MLPNERPKKRRNKPGMNAPVDYVKVAGVVYNTGCGGWLAIYPEKAGLVGQVIGLCRN